VLSTGTEIDDLEWRNGRYFALFCGIRPLPRTHPRKILATPMSHDSEHPHYLIDSISLTEAPRNRAVCSVSVGGLPGTSMSGLGKPMSHIWPVNELYWPVS